ncbi:hypothetical protein G6541_23120, partial [Streptomyces albidoflavus]|nr:hypothetical protein [Streptomyces albidoflavus]
MTGSLLYEEAWELSAPPAARLTGVWALVVPDGTATGPAGAAEPPL